MNPMASSFSRILALAVVVLAVHTEAVEFLTQFLGCTNSDDGAEVNSLFLASACQSAGSGTSLGGSCSNKEFKLFNSTDCTGTVLQTFNDTCTTVSTTKIRFDCENIDDQEYIRLRAFPRIGTSSDFDCNASPLTTFIRLNKCYENLSPSFPGLKYAKVNSTAFSETTYSATGCDDDNIIQTKTALAIGECNSDGIRMDFILAGDVGNSASFVRISGYILSFALAFAGLLLM